MQARIKQKSKANSIPCASHKTPNPARYRSDVRRYTICALFLSLSALTAYSLSLRLISQIHYLRARNFMQQGYYGLASKALQKATNYQPGDFKIHRHLGNATLRLAELSPTTSGAYALAKKARAHYREAFRLNPLDSQSVYGLAWEENSLERWYTRLNPGGKPNPHNALPFYELAIRLRPNGSRYHFALAGYLYRRGKQDELHRVIRKLTRIFPPAYTQLRKENFWSYSVKAACRQGLQEAIKDNILPAAAHMGLFKLAEEENDWTNAIAHYRQGLQLQPTSNTYQSYFRLGRMLLKNGDVQAARDSFVESFSLSRSREKHLLRIYKLFRNEGALNEFNDFYHNVQQQFALSAQSGILLAQNFIDLKQYDQARRILEELIAIEPRAGVYYWLAQVAKKEQDWDRMEHTIQKATVLDPENNNYRRIFINLLKRKKNFQTAELQLDLMIENSEVASASLLDEKAWLRWNQKDYDTALQTWQSAIRLKPDDAVYYARAAEAYVMIGDWSKAVDYYQKATRLDPRNKRYKKRYQQIMESDSEG